MANQTTDTSLNGGAVNKATSKVQSALENIDMDEIRSQVKEIVRAGDEFRRTRPALFWGAVAGIGILIAYLAMRPMSGHIASGRAY